MSLDFDSGALQTQQDEEEYDREDYARDQELKQLLTDLPHDMLEDSGDLSSDSSDCSAKRTPSGGHQPWEHERSWSEHQLETNPQAGGYVDHHGKAQYCAQFVHQNLNGHGHNFGQQQDVQKQTNGWSDPQSEDEDGSAYDINYSYPARRTQGNAEGEAYHPVTYETEENYQQSAIYHLPEDFQPYTNGHKQEFTKQDAVPNFPDTRLEHMQRLTALDSHPVDSFQVKYNPYQGVMQHKAPLALEGRGVERFDEMQKEFLNPGENNSENMQIVQLQVLYKARGRQLEELNEKLEESGREMRGLNHQLAMIQAEKEGLAMSLQESQKLFQNGRDREVQLLGQIKALEANIQTLSANEEQQRKKLGVTEVSLENMQQQLMDLHRSDSLKRARDQHESIVAALKQKNEDQLLQLQQRLDAANAALQEQKDHCCDLEDHVKQLERKQEEGKLEKNEIINRLTRSLDESQKQCANLLQTGTIQEISQLRFQLQQAHSSKMMIDSMNKALQEELKELKEQVGLYESAANLGVYVNGIAGESEVDLSESYVDLGIQNVNWKKARYPSILRNKDTPANLTKDELIIELKGELERSLTSSKAKRQQVSQLQQTLKEHHEKIDELKKQLEKSERTTRDYEVRTESMEKHMDTLWPYSSSSSENLKEEIQKLKTENQALQQQVEKHLSCVQELTKNEENLQSKNQELCNEMRQLIEEFDRDKQEAINRCERTYQLHHEDIMNHFQKELSEKYVAEKEQLERILKEKMSQLQVQLEQKDQDMTAVQECYIAVCREKDALEDTLRKNMSHEITSSEEKIKEMLLKEKEAAIKTLKEKHQEEFAAARSQWLKDKEAALKRELETQVALTAQLIKETEKHWQQRLDKTIEDMKRAALKDVQDCEIQTGPNESNDPLSKEMLEGLQLKLETALREKEKAVQQAVLVREAQHRENISKQVETAVTNAHIRWLQELTSFAEYKAALKAEKEKWEKENELVVAKKISAVLTTAEEKWNQEHIKHFGSNDKPLINVKQKELEEKITFLSRELERKTEEHAAQVKAELARARAEWNKDKQEEINRIREQNEKDYRTFLDGHRNKIKEALAQAKEDCERQKADLVIEKKTEMKEYVEQNRKEWMANETKMLQEHENEILVLIDCFLGKIHLQITKGSRDKWSLNEKPVTTTKLGSQFQEKLMDCLQNACQQIVGKSLEIAMQEQRKKNGICPPGRTGSNEHLRRQHVNEAQDKIHRNDMKMAADEQGMKNDPNATKCRPDPQNGCCEHGFQELVKSKSECQELKSKLEKACRHLQLAVKEHKARGEQLKEYETIIDSLKKENNEVKKKSDEMNSYVKTSSLQFDGAVGNSCTFGCGKGLEEMRSQYIMAVDKIREDMLRYIQESRERAAEMLRVEVLKERQETARKMRKYYLVCLQQLLKDDGKNEGAEKKIMNAASKLATMAKVLETPISHKSHSRPTRAARTQNGELPAGSSSSKNCSKGKGHLSNGDIRSKDYSVSKFNDDEGKSIPHPPDQRLRDEVTMELAPATYSRGAPPVGTETMLKDVLSGFADDSGKNMFHNTMKAAQQCLGHSSHLQNPASGVSKGRLKTMNAFNWNGGLSDSESDHVPFHIQVKQPPLNVFLPNRSTAYGSTASEKSPRFDIQETPVRDESQPNDWSLLSQNTDLDSNALAHLNPTRKENSVKRVLAQAQSCCPFGPRTAVSSLAAPDESLHGFGTQTFTENNPGHAGDRKPTNCSKENLSGSKGRQNLPKSFLGTGFSEPSSASAGTGVANLHKQHARKLLFNSESVQQDSGFDSPLTNFNS